MRIFRISSKRFFFFSVLSKWNSATSTTQGRGMREKGEKSTKEKNCTNGKKYIEKSVFVYSPVHKRHPVRTLISSLKTNYTKLFIIQSHRSLAAARKFTYVNIK